MKKSILLASLLLTLHPNAHAGLFEDIRRGIENAAPISPRSIKCEDIRNDANRHQATIRQNLDIASQNLNDANYSLNSAVKRKEDLTQRQTVLFKQESLLNQFQNINQGLIFSEASLRQGLSNIQSSATAQSLNEILSSMENDPSHPQMTQLASLIRSMTSRNATEIDEPLKNNQGQALVQQMSILIGTTQVMLAEEKAHNASSLTQAETEISYHTDRVNQLQGSINQLNGDWSAQEERKSCNF